MAKKLWINVYSSPYVDMDNIDKLENGAEPLPMLMQTHIGGTDLLKVELANEIINTVSAMTGNQVVHICNGDYIIYADLIVYNHCDFIEILESLKENKKLNLNWTDAEAIKSYNVYKISDTLVEHQGNEHKLSNNEDLLVDRYYIANIGATAEEIIEIIASAIIVLDSVGGIRKILEYIKYFCLILRKEQLFNDKVFYNNFYRMHRMERNECAMLTCRRRTNGDGFNVVIRFGDNVYKIVTNKSSKIIKMNIESMEKWKEYIN